jgi:hypothetical protein
MSAPGSEGEGEDKVATHEIDLFQNASTVVVYCGNSRMFKELMAQKAGSGRSSLTACSLAREPADLGSHLRPTVLTGSRNPFTRHHSQKFRDGIY